MEREGIDSARPWERGTATVGVVYQLKLTVKEIQPEIWRRIMVHAEVTLTKLHICRRGERLYLRIRFR